MADTKVCIERSELLLITATLNDVADLLPGAVTFTERNMFALQLRALRRSLGEHVAHNMAVEAAEVLRRPINELEQTAGKA